jgi:hypothetical protein
VKFYIIAFALLSIAAGGGFWLGHGLGRNQFTNECITVGNFTVWDYGTDKRRRFVCTEAPWESKPLVDDKVKL